MYRAIEWARHAFSSILPEGRLKESMRSLRQRYYDPLDVLVTKVEILEDGSLLVELNSGVKFYAQRDTIINDDIHVFPPRKYRHGYIEPRAFAKTTAIESYTALWATLREIYVDNMYEKYYRFKKGDIIVDAGAHIGVFTIKAAKAVGDEGKVIAIEPEMDNLRFLGRNLQANSLRNVVVVKKGVWSDRGRLRLFLGKNGERHSLLNLDAQNKFVEVDVDTLDNILRELGVCKVDFVKMDIEGAEIEAYKGMTSALKQNLNLAISAYHVIEGEQTNKTIAPWLEENGFSVYTKNGIVHAIKN
jgi:FkbM family methyltransferase